jgi:hypothetical protein
VAQFRVGDRWTAYVQPTGDFIVRNEARRTVCRGNLRSGKETMPLSEDYTGELERMLLEREQVFQKGKYRFLHSNLSSEYD